MAYPPSHSWSAVSATGPGVPDGSHHRLKTGEETMTQMTQAYDWRGRQLVDTDGDKVGTIEELFHDQDTEQPEWAAVRTGLFGTRLSFVPIESAQPDGEQVRVPFSKSQIKDAPKIDDADGQLSQQEEAELYS